MAKSGCTSMADTALERPTCSLRSGSRRSIYLRAYGTFVEYTNLVGALGFEQTVGALSPYALVCIDEFELDDPGDTVLMSTLLTRLAEQGVRLAATSNTIAR